MAWHAETAVVTQWCFFFVLRGVTQSAPFPACASDSSPSCPLPIHMCCSISYLCADGLSMALTSHTMLAMDARAAVALLRDWRSEHTTPCPAVQLCMRHAVSIVVRAGATLLPPPEHHPHDILHHQSGQKCPTLAVRPHRCECAAPLFPPHLDPSAPVPRHLDSGWCGGPSVSAAHPSPAWCFVLGAVVVRACANSFTQQCVSTLSAGCC